MRLGVRAVVAVEPASIIESDVAEQRDLEPESDSRSELEVEGPDLAPQVPDVASVEEDHTVEGMNNGKLLLHGVEGHEVAARVTHAGVGGGVPEHGVTHPRNRRRVDAGDELVDRADEAVELLRHHLVIVVAAQRIGGRSSAEPESLVEGSAALLVGVRAEQPHPGPQHGRDPLQERRQVHAALDPVLVEVDLAAEGSARELVLRRQARALGGIEGVVRAVAKETGLQAVREHGPAEAEAREGDAVGVRERAERVHGHRLDAERQRAARVVRPGQRTADASRAAHALLLVEVELAPGVEQREAEQGRGVVEPGLGEAQVVVAALAAALEVERQALTVPEHVVVSQLEEARDAALAGVAGARRGGADLLLLYLEVDVDVGAVGRGEVDLHVLEQPEAGDVPLGAHQRRALEAVALVDRHLAPDHLLAGVPVAEDVHHADRRGPPLGDAERHVHHRVPHRLARLDAEVEVAPLGVLRVGLPLDLLDPGSVVLLPRPGLPQLLEGGGVQHLVAAPGNLADAVEAALLDGRLQGQVPRLVAGLEVLAQDPHVPVAVAVVVGLQPFLVLGEVLLLDLAPAEEALGLALHALAQLVLRKRRHAREHDARDLDALALAHHEAQRQMVRSRAGVRHRLDRGLGEAFLVVVPQQRVDLGAGGGRRVDLAGMEEQLLLELGGRALLVAAELDLRDARPLADMDHHVHLVAVRERLHPHVVEQPEREQLADPAPHLLVGVAAAARHLERAQDARAVGEGVAGHRDAPDLERCLGFLGERVAGGRIGGRSGRVGGRLLARRGEQRLPCGLAPSGSGTPRPGDRPGRRRPGHQEGERASR